MKTIFASVPSLSLNPRLNMEKYAIVAILEPMWLTKLYYTYNIYFFPLSLVKRIYFIFFIFEQIFWIIFWEN